LQEKPREKQSIALAARKHFRGHPDAVGAEKEILEIAVDVPRTALEGDRLRIARDVLRHGLGVVDLPAQLIEIDDLEVRAELDRARLGRELAQQQFEQRGL